MRQQVEVKRVDADGYAQVEAIRRSACSGECHHCGGCDTVQQHVFVRAKNLIGAQVGQRVIVETSSPTVLLAALIVYLLPLFLLLFGYFVAVAIQLPVWIFCLTGFLLGLGLAIAYNCYITNRGRLEFTITAFVGQ